VVIVPSIDVRARSVAGRSEATDPLALAKALVEQGAEELHLVDLDGAETGVLANAPLLASVAHAVGVPCRLAGGLSSLDEAREALERGFAGVLFSSAVFGDDELLGEIARMGAAAIVEIESRDGFLAPRGGERALVSVATGRGALASARAAVMAGVRELYLVDLSGEGRLGGPPLVLVDAVRAVAGPRVALHAGGGIRDLDDVRALARRGVASAVIGRALAEGRFTISQAKAVSK